jgi:polyisoprenoid-binding protein YceI
MSTTEKDLQGLSLKPGTWTIDPAHTTIGAVARHLMVTKVRGRFEKFEGAIEVAEKVEDSRAELTMEAASINTGVEQRDEHLKSPDFLDVETYPNLTFKSTSVVPKGDDRFELTGDLTIRDVTRPIVLDARFEGAAPSPFGSGEIAFFSAKAELEREDFGMVWNVALEAGGVLVSKKFQIEIEAQFKREA